MKATATALAAIVLLAISVVGQLKADFIQATVPPKSQPEMRIFLFSARPSPEGWQFTKGKNYIIAAAPDGQTAQAMLIQRLSSGWVLEFDAIELVKSSEMPSVKERLTKLEAADSSGK